MAASARHAFFWSAIDVVAKQGTAFAVSVVLARMLAPEIFGIVTVLLVFVSIANVVVDAGFSTALIQDPNPGQDDATTVFCSIWELHRKRPATPLPQQQDLR